MIEEGVIGLASGNENNHVGAMTGVCSPSMPVWVVEDEGSGARAFSTFNEGAGKTLWFGTDADEAIERLRFFRDDLGPLMGRLIDRQGPIEIFKLAAQGLHQGDELHMRSQATGNLLIRDLLPGFAALGGEQAARFLSTNWHFFLSLTMGASKCTLLAGSGVPGSSVVSLISRNGTDVGVQLSSMPGRWFIADSPPVSDALLREGYEESDKAKDIGDSAVIECVGLGGMAVGASPAVAAFFGGDAADAIARTERMREICAGRSTRFTIPAMDSAPTPVGIDARLVCELGSRRRSRPACCTSRAASGRSAPASPTSRSSRSRPRRSRSRPSSTRGAAAKAAACDARRSRRAAHGLRAVAHRPGRAAGAAGCRRRHGRRGRVEHGVRARAATCASASSCVLLAPARSPLGPLSILVAGLARGDLVPGDSGGRGGRRALVGPLRIELAAARAAPPAAPGAARARLARRARGGAGGRRGRTAPSSGPGSTTWRRAELAAAVARAGRPRRGPDPRRRRRARGLRRVALGERRRGRAGRRDRCAPLGRDYLRCAERGELPRRRRPCWRRSAPATPAAAATARGRPGELGRELGRRAAVGHGGRRAEPGPRARDPDAPTALGRASGAGRASATVPAGLARTRPPRSSAICRRDLTARLGLHGLRDAHLSTPLSNAAATASASMPSGRRERARERAGRPLEAVVALVLAPRARPCARRRS